MPKATVPKAAATAAEDSPSKPPPRRRDRRNRYRNASPSTLDRRREQNRVSQQTFREKKDQRIKELESKLQEAEKKLEEAERKCEFLGQDFATLLREHMKMKAAAHRNISDPLNVPVANGASVGQAPTNVHDTHQAEVEAIQEAPRNPNQDGCNALDCMEWIEQSIVDT